ncbi:hypothetical protein GJAV_G00014410 [Gymnothorax javanicus]|nr:hypothetical protein GJAV_G00014410 [Gymnothorax javanicus]
MKGHTSYLHTSTTVTYEEMHIKHTVQMSSVKPHLSQLFGEDPAGERKTLEYGHRIPRRVRVPQITYSVSPLMDNNKRFEDEVPDPQSHSVTACLIRTFFQCSFE